MRGWERRALVARVGAAVFAGALCWPLALPSTAARTTAVLVADVSGEVSAPPIADALDMGSLPAWLEASIDAPETRIPRAPRARVLSASSVGVAPTRPLAHAPAAPPSPPAPVVTEGYVIASWYGPGFYGDRTACGQTYTPQIQGVAHLTLRCGTLIRITSPSGKTVVVPVIDRGPYVAGRTLDLSNATRAALACTDLCRVHMLVVR